MFYAQFVLSKKGPLAKIWLAAHWEKKLSKAQIYETNVQDAVDEILKPKVKMALRTTGHLLLGIVRIYSRKTKYLLADCNEAFLKIKMAFRPGQIELQDDGREVNGNMQVIPEVYTDFDTALPDFNDVEFASHLQISQSRVDDITLKEDLVVDSNFNYDEFGMDDFGEGAVGVSNFGEEDFAQALGTSEVEEGRDRHSVMESMREGTPLDGKIAPGAPLFSTDDDFGAMDVGDDDMDGGMFNDNMSAIMNLDAPGADINDDLQVGAAANNIQRASVAPEPESFVLDPLEPGALDKVQEKKRRKRKLVIDEPKSISGEDMKANMAEYQDTLQQLDLAPPTRKLMKMKEAGTAERLLHMPGFPARSLVRIYQSHLVPRAHVVHKPGDILRELDMKETIDEDIPFAPPESNFGDDPFDDMGIMDFDAPPREDTPPILPTLTELPEESPSKDLEDSPIEKKKRKTLNETRTEEDEAVDGDEDHRWTKRTQGVLNSISTKLRSTGDEISMNDLLTKGATRKTVAQKFYTLLVLKKWQAIDVRQTEPYGEIFIAAGPNIAQTAQ